MFIRKSSVTDANSIAKVHVDTWKHTYKGIVSDGFLKQLNYDMVEEHIQTMYETNEISGLVAENEKSTIVGFIAYGINKDEQYPYAGEVYAIYVDPSHQAKGIGKLLFNAAAKDLLDKGVNSLIIWALKGNSYRRFYDNLGGKLVGTKNVDIGGEEYEELGYGWDNLSGLIR